MSLVVFGLVKYYLHTCIQTNEQIEQTNANKLFVWLELLGNPLFTLFMKLLVCD